MTPIRILHLEDSRKDAELVHALLGAEGIACEVVRMDTREGFIAALERGGFDLILGDYSLPSFDGLSALKIAVEKSPDVPFIFVSGTPAEDAVIEAVNNGATDYVPKQNLQRLGLCIRRAMREAQERAQRRHAESELQARYRELEILHTISQDILGSADLKALLERILRRIASFASFDLGVIRLLDPIRQVLIPSASYGYHDESAIRVHSVKSGDPTAGRIQIASVAGHGAFVEEDVNAAPGLRTFKAEGARSAVIVPVEAEGNVLGTILLGNRMPTRFPPELVRTLEAIGSQMSVAVQKARLYDEAQQNLARIRALHEIDLAITSSLDLRTILDVLLEKTERLLPHIAATTVRLLNRETGELAPIACRNLPEGEWKAATAQAASRDLRRLLPNDDNSPVAILNVQTDAGALAPDFLRKYGLVSGLRVPLTAENEVLGVITFFTSEQHEFGPEEIEFLSTLAERGAIAIENAALYERTAQRAREQAALSSIATAATEVLDIDKVLHFSLEKVAEITGRETAYIRLKDPANGGLRLVAHRGLSDDYVAALATRGPGQRSQQVFASGQALIIDDAAATDLQQISGKRERTNMAWFPLIAHGQAVGLLNLGTTRLLPFSDNEVNLVRAISNVIAVAIQNARLYQEAIHREARLQQTHRHLEALHAVTVQASQSLDHLETVTRGVIQKITEIFDFDATRIYICNDRRDELLLSAHFEKEPERFSGVGSFAKGQGIPGRVVESGEPLIFEDITMDPIYLRTSKTRNSERTGHRFFAALPIKSGRLVLGTIVCIGIAPRRLSAEEVQLLTSMAGQIAVAVENASLYDEITKRVDELQRKTWELEKANKVKTEFLGIMSHELRTPLNVIMGYTDLLLDGALGEINTEQGDGLRAVMKQSKDLRTMVENVVVATNAEAGALVARWEKISLTEFLDELQQSHSVPAAKEVKLRWDYQTDFSLVETDADRLRQILHNLINNAIKYTEKGTVTVTARIIEDSKQKAVSSKENAQAESQLSASGILPAASCVLPPTSSRFMEFSVQDTGIGIEKKNLPVIFDIFHQVDSSNTRAYEGVGLGLYIAGKLTELLGGTIEVESEINRGSMFTVRIPVQRTADSKR